MKSITKIKAITYPLIIILIAGLLVFLGTRDNH